MSLQLLREERARIAAQMRELSEKPTDKWDAAVDPGAWDKISDALNIVDTKIQAAIKADEILAETTGAMTAAERADQLGRDKGNSAMSQFARWLRKGDSAISAAEWADIRNTMSTTTNSEGGFTVQTSVATSVIDYLKAYGGVRSVANVIQTSMGNTIQFPISDGTSETGEWIGQNTTATGADIVFSSVTVPVFKASSKIVAVPIELLQDSQVDIEALVNQRFVDRLGRLMNAGFTTGNGTTAPNGFVTAAGTGVTLGTGNTTSLTYAGFVDLVHSVDPAYRAAPNCVMMMNDATVKAARKVLDNSNRPIFSPGWDNTFGQAANGTPDTLMGYRIVINQDMAVPAANAKTVAFGDFSKYLIRDVMDMTVFRFTDSAYTKLGQVGFLAWLRTGANLLDTNGIKLLVQSAT